LIFFLSLVGRYIAQRFNQPGVLGELLMGGVVGNLCYFFHVPQMMILREGSAIFSMMHDLLSEHSLTDAIHASVSNISHVSALKGILQAPNGMDLIRVAYVLDTFSRYGVIFLLFMVGLESSIEEMKHTGRESLQVAFIGIVVPMLLGFCLIYWCMPGATFAMALFVGATLSATSVGITARVLKEMHKMKTREAKTILGAAMIDDVLGLLMLAIVSSIVITGGVEIVGMVQIIVWTILFFAATLYLGPRLLTFSVRFISFLDPWEAKLVASFLFIMLLAWLATCVQLASIIGAFAAGLIIRDEFFDHQTKDEKTCLSIHALFAPLELLLAPLFFMLIGIQVKLESFFDWHVLIIAFGLLVVAVLGKLVSGLGAAKKDDRLLIGIGMLPRGEVGLVFASIGRTLGVVSDQLFSAIILMVIVTTFITPPWLKLRFNKHQKVL
jgi:Kef-type K+ transport system membrane component KefB